jgi:transcriptional regulator with XRE-family HTH domain
MSKIEMTRIFDPAVVEAEENLLIDLQFLLQKTLTDTGATRADLAKKLGVSKARLSQIFAAEANPTVKSCARLFHAIGKEITVCVKAEVEPVMSGEVPDWRFETEDNVIGRRKRAAADDCKWVVLLKEAIDSNDNYRNQVEIWAGGEPNELQAA